MNIKHLEALVWIVRLGSFRAAADRLNVTQAAISSRMNCLEEEFQARLLERDPREAKLTAAGRVFFRHAEKVLEVSRHLQEAMRSGSSLAGRIRIGAIETIAHTWLKELIGTVSRSHPALELELTVGPTLHLQDCLRRGMLDIALQTEPIVGEGIRNVELGSVRLTWIGSMRHALRPNRDFAEIAASPIITMTRGSQQHVALLELCQRQAVLPATIHCVSSLAVIIELVKSEMGFALVAKAPVQQFLDEESVLEITTSTALPALRLISSYRDDPTGDAARIVAEIAKLEADRYAFGVECAAVVPVIGGAIEAGAPLIGHSDIVP